MIGNLATHLKLTAGAVSDADRQAPHEIKGDIRSPDAALLALGERFDQAHREWASDRPAYEAASKAWDAALQGFAETRGNKPVPDEVYFRLFAEADPDGVLKREEEFCATRIFPLAEAILATPAATVEGLAVKVRVLTFATKQQIWGAKDVEDLGWDEQVLRDMVDAVLRLAGVDRMGNPTTLAGEAAHV